MQPIFASMTRVPGVEAPLTKLSPGAKFSKNLMTNLGQTYGKDRLTKNLGWACDYQKILQKSYEKIRTLCRTYENLRRHNSSLTKT